tara:strand:+ start:430 stop:834 length:405 start_codon:yes stop_codon:yes gene_type:complete
MLFNQNKGFFLTLDETAEPVSLDLPEAAAVEEPAADASVTAQPSLVVEAPAASEATTTEAKAVDEVAATGAAVQTTAEAIAAELAATQAARPVVTMSTYAPDNLMPGAGLMARKRRPGAGMKGFMTIAGDLFKS